MKNSNFYKAATGAVVLLLLSFSGNAQLVSCNAFLQGNYIEVGVNGTGAFGSSVAAPSGYHPRGGAGVINPCTGLTTAFGTGLGFVADPAKDGWMVGSPAYFGDYFLPGSPYEGWSIEINGTQANNFNGYTAGISGSITSVTNSGRTRTAVWQGTYGGLAITQVSSFDTGNLFFSSNVTLRNTTGSTLSDVYYGRGVDPDNEEALSGNYSTNNTITYQRPDSLNATLASAVGQEYGAYLGLGTLDCRARCYILPDWPPTSVNCDVIYSGAPGFTYSGINNGDYAIGIVYNLGNIPAGSSVNFSFAYVLSGAYITNAFSATAPLWTATGDFSGLHASGDTANICASPGTTIVIDNPDTYTWTWTSLTGETLSTTAGPSTSVSTDTTVISLMAVGTGGCSGVNDTLYVHLRPVASPAISAGSGVAICSGFPATLSATGGSSYTWSPSDDLSCATCASPVANPTVTTTYTVTGTNSFGCSNTATEQVTVNPIPTISTDSGVAICNGSSTTLNAAGGTTYTWAPSTGLSATTGSNVTANPSATRTYTVTGTTDGCSNVATVTVTVNGLPIAYNVTGGGIYCAGRPGIAIGLSNSDTGIKYQLMNGTPAGSPLAGTGAALDFGLFTASGTYTVIAANPVTTCIKQMNAGAVISLDTLFSPIVTVSISPLGQLHAGQTVTFTAHVSGGGGMIAYQWIDNLTYIAGATNNTYTNNNFYDLDPITVVVSDSTACGNTITGKTVVLSIHDVAVQQVFGEGSNLTLIPNPNKGIFTVKGSLGTANNEDVQLIVTDIVGQVILKQSVKALNGELNEQIALNNSLANGMYLLNIQSVIGNKVLHFVVQQ